MIIHNPEITGSLGFPKLDGTKVVIRLSSEDGLETIILDASGSEIGIPASNFSGSFTGSFLGDGSQLTGVAASQLNIDLFTVGTIAADDQLLFSDTDDNGTEKRGTFVGGLNSLNVISGSSQVDVEQTTNFTEFSSSIAGTFAGLSSDFNDLENKPTLVSGSSQILFNGITDNAFSASGPDVITSKNIIPSNLNIDLGSPSAPFKDLYLSSASLYVDGTQVISSNTNELIITTDANQSLKLVETGADTVQIQTENGDITLTSSGTGNIELDAPIQIVAGNQIISSDGNAIQFGEDIDIDGDLNVQGNIILTGTVDGVDVLALSSSVADQFAGLSPDYNDLINIPSGIVSGSSQISLSGFSTTDLSEGTNLYYTDARVKTKLNTEGVISSSAQITITESQISDLDHYTDSDFDARLATKTTTDLDEGTNLYYTDTRVKTKLNTEGVISSSAQIAPFFDPTLTINGDASGSATFTNLGDATLTLTIVDDSHNHTIANVDGLQTALDGKQSAGSYVTTNSVQALSSNANALTFAGNVLTLTRGDGSTDTINLSAYLDDTNLARIISGVYNSDSQELVFTRDDASTFSIDASMFFDNTNLVLSVNGRTGTVTTALSDYGITATSAEINKLDGVTATTTELNYVDGVTSNIQTQLNGKLSTSHDFTITLTGDVTGAGTVTNMGNVSFSTTVANDSHSHSNYITSNANDTASGIYTFSNTTASTSTTTGAVKVTGGLGIGGDVYVGGDVVAYASSDERLKKNIEIISKPIEKVQQLKGVTWNWKDEASEAQKSTPALGVIAQDVEKVLPQLVDTRENGYKAVDYGKLTGLLIEAIKDQQKQIDDLKSRLS